MRNTQILLALFISFGLIFSLILGYLILTPYGSSFLAKQWLLHSGYFQQITIQRATGNLLEGLQWEGVSVQGVKQFPGCGVVGVGKVIIKEPLRRDRQISIQGGELLVRESSTGLSFNGFYSSGDLAFDVQSAEILIEQLVKLYPAFDLNALQGGTIHDVKIHIKQIGKKIAVQGDFQVRAVRYQNLLLKEGAATISLSVDQQNELTHVSGQCELVGLKGSLKNIAESQIRVDKLLVLFSGNDATDVSVSIFDGRLNLPGADQIFFNGGLQNKLLKLNLFTKWISVRQIISLLGDKINLGDISGTIIDVDLNVLGAIGSPQVKGGFIVEKAQREGFSLNNAHCYLNLQTRDIYQQIQLFGSLLVKDGALFGPKSARIAIQESSVSWKGEPGIVQLNLRGNALVEKTKIDIRLKGAFVKPELKLTSSPPLPQDRLLVMLLTNRRWNSADKLVDQRKLSVDLAKDFLDYFMFDGMSQKLSQSLGISDISITIDKSKKGVGAKKSVTEKTDITYAIEQSQDKDGKTSNVQKVGGEYKLTDAVSVGAEREFTVYDKTVPVLERQPPADKFMLKYKTDF